MQLFVEWRFFIYLYFYKTNDLYMLLRKRVTAFDSKKNSMVILILYVRLAGHIGHPIVKTYLRRFYRHDYNSSGTWAVKSF